MRQQRPSMVRLSSRLLGRNMRHLMAAVQCATFPNLQPNPTSGSQHTQAHLGWSQCAVRVRRAAVRALHFEGGVGAAAGGAHPARLSGSSGMRGG